MLFTSPHAKLSLPSCSLPELLLSPASAPKPDARVKLPVLHPPPHDSPTCTRPLAAPLSLVDVQRMAYHIAAGLLDEEVMAASGGAIKKGDVVVLLTLNQHDYLPIVLGIQLAGGIPALCNPMYTPRELQHQLRMTSARAIIAASTRPPTKPDAAKPPNSPYDTAIEAGKLATSDMPEDEEEFEKLPREPIVWAWEEGAEHSWKDEVELKGKERGAEGRKAVEQRAKEIKPEDTAVLCFSSGTSGKPKAVCLSHGNLVANTIQATFLLHDRMNDPLDEGRRFSDNGRRGWYDDARAHEHNTLKVKSKSTGKRTTWAFRARSALFHLVGDRKKEENGEFHQDVLPQFHCYGLLVNLVALHTATPRVILPRFELRTFLSVIQAKQVTFAFVVPPILLALATSPVVDEYDVSSLWRVASGAASLADELVKKASKRLGIKATDGYGMSEMSPIIAMQTLADIEAAPGSIGVLAPNTEAKLIDLEGKELGPGEEGELLLRGPQMMTGYLHNDKANAEAFYPTPDTPRSEQWLRTGDIVKIDTRGYVTITDRAKDVIKAKGFQVSPAELEALLYRDNNVSDCAVIGVKDPKDGSELPWAFIVPNAAAKEKQPDDDARAKEVLGKINSDVAGYKRIKGVTWIDEVPKSAAGKVLKKDLRGLVKLPE